MNAIKAAVSRRRPLDNRLAILKRPARGWIEVQYCVATESGGGTLRRGSWFPTGRLWLRGRSGCGGSFLLTRRSGAGVTVGVGFGRRGAPSCGRCCWSCRRSIRSTWASFSRWRAQVRAKLGLQPKPTPFLGCAHLLGDRSHRGQWGLLLTWVWHGSRLPCRC